MFYIYLYRDEQTKLSHAVEMFPRTCIILGIVLVSCSVLDEDNQDEEQTSHLSNQDVPNKQTIIKHFKENKLKRRNQKNKKTKKLKGRRKNLKKNNNKAKSSRKQTRKCKKNRATCLKKKLNKRRIKFRNSYRNKENSCQKAGKRRGKGKGKSRGKNKVCRNSKKIRVKLRVDYTQNGKYRKSM